jgi:predicted nucleotidyltransferase
VKAAHGLTEQTVERIQTVLDSFPQVEKAVVYGSRAKGNFKPGSDIDLTLFGEGLTEKILSRIYWALDDLLLPCRIDLSLFSGLKHPALIDHIRRVGIVLYVRQPATARQYSR